MGEIDIAADFGDLVGEGPVWDADTGVLYWTDLVGQKFCQLTWLSRKAQVLRNGVEVTGFALNRAGGFVVANTHGIWLWDGEGDSERACKPAFPGAPFLLNPLSLENLPCLLNSKSPASANP